MNTYIILSRFSPEAFDDPKHFLELAEQVSKKIKSDCPGVRWKESYATLGRFDVVDIVEAADLAARQLVVHGHILVNGRKVDRPSNLLAQGDVISLREKTKKMLLVEEGLAKSRARPELPYLQVDKTNLTGTLTSVPERARIPLEINEALIMEHYSRYI